MYMFNSLFINNKELSAEECYEEVGTNKYEELLEKFKLYIIYDMHNVNEDD